MMPNIKNIILFTSLGVALVLLYVFVIRKSPDEANLVFTPTGGPDAGDLSELSLSSPGRDFLPILLNVKNIKLDDSIFADPAFMALVDGSITLIPDTDEGRPNPFAPLGSEKTSSGTPPPTNPSR